MRLLKKIQPFIFSVSLVINVRTRLTLVVHRQLHESQNLMIAQPLTPFLQFFFKDAESNAELNETKTVSISQETAELLTFKI